MPLGRGRGRLMEELAGPVASIAAISAGLLVVVVMPIAIVRTWLARGAPPRAATALEPGPLCPGCAERTVRGASFCHACGTSLEDRRW